MKNFLFLILLLFFLVGCQPQELKVDTTETAKTPITTQDETVEGKGDARPLYVSNVKPRELNIMDDDQTKHIPSPILKYCWSEVPGECKEELNMDPKEQLANLPDFIVKPSSSLTYSMIRANPGSTLPLPTNIELFSHQDGTYTPVEVQVGDEASFQAPAEEGTFVYVLKASYEGDVNGITFYAFHFRVRL